MPNALATFIGWSIVPNIATNFLQSVYYGIAVRAGDPKPQPGSPAYARHYRRIRISLIAAYLVYTFYEASHVLRQKGDFYQLLSVPLDVDDRGVKSRFRRLAALHHPDKAGAAGGSHDYYALLKTAHETLTKEALRFAYDRFGPDALRWQHCATPGDYLAAGLQAWAPMYIGSGVVMTVLGVTGWLQWGRFWRYYLTAALVALEVYTVTRPQAPWILAEVINPALTTFTSHPPLLQFQFLELARSFTFTTFLGLSQLGPQLQQRPGEAGVGPNDVPPALLNMMEQVARGGDAEATRLLAMEMAAYAGQPAQTRELQGRVKEWLVQNTIRSNPHVKPAVEAAVRRRREVVET